MTVAPNESIHQVNQQLRLLGRHLEVTLMFNHHDLP